MGWAIGYDSKWNRDIGYGVPCQCDHPDCTEQVDRGLSHVCGGEPYGGDHGCGLHFCNHHLPIGDQGGVPLCDRCISQLPPYTPKADIEEWIQFKLTDGSWARWRAENPEWVANPV